MEESREVISMLDLTEKELLDMDGGIGLGGVIVLGALTYIGTTVVTTYVLFNL